MSKYCLALAWPPAIVKFLCLVDVCKTMMVFGRPLIVVISSNWEKDIELKFVFMFFLLFKDIFLTVNVLYNVKDFNPQSVLIVEVVR